MKNNDILRRLRYTFDLNDDALMRIFQHANVVATREEICDWLKKDDDPNYKEISDTKMVAFLDGFIVSKRGPSDKKIVSEYLINNNIVLRKLKIALKLQAEDMLEMLKLADFSISKHELSAFFRRIDHKHFRLCNDQILRRFLKGLQIKYKK